MNLQKKTWTHGLTLRCTCLLFTLNLPPRVNLCTGPETVRTIAPEMSVAL